MSRYMIFPETGDPRPLAALEAATPASPSTIDEERDFYDTYAWAVNAFPTVAHTASVLRGEIRRLPHMPRDWRMREVMTNVWLLSCALSDSVDDWLLGERYDFQGARALPLGGAIAAPIEQGLARWSSLRLPGRAKVTRWRSEWEEAVGIYLLYVVEEIARLEGDARGPTARLESLLSYRLPPQVLRRRIKLPSAFRSQDLTIYDLPALADKFAAEMSDSSRPILVVGCRTAGSYFAPMLRACLKVRGWDNVDSTTIRPNKGTGSEERLKLAAIARQSGLVVITDEPIGTGATLIKAVRLLQRAGVAKKNIVALHPIHPHNRDYSAWPDAPALCSLNSIRLEPEERYKYRTLTSGSAKHVLTTYFEHHGEKVDSVIEDERNVWLDGRAETTYHSRAKRLYQVRVRKRDGSPATRYVLAKSVGHGWLSYHAFLAGARLSRFVPPVLGLRDGILYTEWLSQPAADPAELEAEMRDVLPRVAGQYIAARAAHLKLPPDGTKLSQSVDHRALNELAGLLVQARGLRTGASLKRERLLNELRSRPCPVPTLIDGKMRPQEWIADGFDIRKSDFEQHGQGKLELNATDPAYDLADTILTWNLSPLQENELIRHYAAASGDYGVDVRLFLYKLLAGAWSKSRALNNLLDSRLLDRHEEFNQQYVRAFDFLTEHTARYCGSLCARPATLRWKAPLIVLDVDGVLDRYLFGYPSNTAAGILAISLLHAHGYSLAFNSARSLRQLRSYCDYYGGLGVVAEYGGIVWDSVSGRSRVLVSDESLRQLERLQAELRKIPGVFLNNDYEYSIRAHVYEGGSTAALPVPLVKDVMTRFATNRIQLHHTVTTTTLVARETDKGAGLSELLALAGQPGAETIAIGDSAADLSMFRVATRSYAPKHIACRAAAELLGCRVASSAYQNGFLESVRAIVHPDGKRCDACKESEARLKSQEDLFVRLLRTADKPRWFRLLSAILDPSAVSAFRR